MFLVNIGCNEATCCNALAFGTNSVTWSNMMHESANRYKADIVVVGGADCDLVVVLRR